MRERKEITLGVCWNLIGQEGNISRVAAGLPEKKPARIIKANLTESPNFLNLKKKIEGFFKVSKVELYKKPTPYS